MNRRNIVHIRKVHIKQARNQDVLQGWVRIPESIRGGIPNGSFVKIRTNDKAIFCQVRGTSSKKHIAEINEHYRDLLGIKMGQELDLDITPQKWFFGKVRALPMHPQHLVRFGFGFSLIGVAMGMLALIIALLPFAIGSLGKPWAWAGYVSIVFLLVLAFFVGFFVNAAIATFKDQ